MRGMTHMLLNTCHVGLLDCEHCARAGTPPLLLPPLLPSPLPFLLVRWMGKGKRSSVVGSFLVAVRDEATGALASFTSVGTGFSDAMLAELTQRLVGQEGAVDGRDYLVSPKVTPDLWLRPSEVRCTRFITHPTFVGG